MQGFLLGLGPWVDPRAFFVGCSFGEQGWEVFLGDSWGYGCRFGGGGGGCGSSVCGICFGGFKRLKFGLVQGSTLVVGGVLPVTVYVLGHKLVITRAIASRALVLST